MNEMFELAINMMDYVTLPAKEDDIEPVQVVSHKAHRKMDREERRKRTIAKAKRRARKDRIAREIDWFNGGSNDLGRYFKAGADVESCYHERKQWNNGLLFNDGDIKRNVVESQRTDIRDGLKDYYEMIGVDVLERETETMPFEVDTYEVVMLDPKSGNYHVAGTTETFKDADCLADSCIDEIIEEKRRQRREEEIREEIKYLRQRIERLEKEASELKEKNRYPRFNNPIIFMVGYDSNGNTTFHETYLD